MTTSLNKNLRDSFDVVDYGLCSLDDRRRVDEWIATYDIPKNRTRTIIIGEATITFQLLALDENNKIQAGPDGEPVEELVVITTVAPFPLERW